MAGARCATRAETMATIIRIAELAIQDAVEEIGADLGGVATGLVKAAIHCAKDLGITIEDAAASAADGALKGANRLSAAAFDTVCRAVTQTIDGVTVVLRHVSSVPAEAPA